MLKATANTALKIHWISQGNLIMESFNVKFFGVSNPPIRSSALAWRGGGGFNQYSTIKYSSNAKIGNLNVKS